MQPKNNFRYEKLDPAENKVNLSALLKAIQLEITGHVQLEEQAAQALALWVVHTYVFQERHAVAYVAIQSPEKRCGKTTLLAVLAGMASKPTTRKSRNKMNNNWSPESNATLAGALKSSP
jgi:hypothetical protein